MNIRDLFFQLIIRMVMLATMVHEYGHLLSLRLMGYTGEIRSHALNMVYPTDVSGWTQAEKLFFYGSGGLFQALIFMILCLWNKDEENRLVNKMVAIQGVIYGLFEGLMPSMWWSFGASVALIASFIFMAVVLIKSNPAPSPAPPTHG